MDGHPIGSPRRRASATSASRSSTSRNNNNNINSNQPNINNSDLNEEMAAVAMDVAPLTPNTASLTKLLFQSSSSSKASKDKSGSTPVPSICDWDSVPADYHFVRCNPYIKTGYRVHHTHWWDHIAPSFFKIHNETVNVHTHFWTAVGLIVTALWMVAMYPFFLQHAELHDFIIVGTSSVAFVYAFAGSAFYHLSNCHSQHVYVLTEKVDYSGVLMFFTFSLVTCFYYGFFCLPAFQFWYTGAVLAFTMVSAPLSFLTSSKLIRVSLLGILTVLGSGATLHWVAKEGMANPDVQLLFPKVWMIWSLLGVAFFFYISKIPERFWPGRINIWCTSHQLWHIFAALGAFYMVHFFAVVYELRKTTVCPS